MKTTNIFKTVTIAAFALVLSSCLGDLDTLPIDKNQLTGEDVYKTADGYRGVIAKCYASLILTGQKGGDGGDKDVPNIDEGYSGYIRALYYIQEGASDETLVQSGSGHGTRTAILINWDPSTMILSYPYYRLYMAIGYCNEFLRECTEGKLKDRGVWDELKGEYEYYRAEARLIRAYSYSMICDLYGSAPFVDETMPVGTIPHQKTRKEIYDYVVSEGEALATALKAPKANQYGRVDQVAAWFLLARVYLNAETWVGAKAYDKAYTYAKKVINEGNYPLEKDWRFLFLADNNKCTEIIWPLVQDADNAQGSAGTNFFVKAHFDGQMNNTVLSGVGTKGWGNIRTKTQLVNKFDADNQSLDPTDPWGDKLKDKRAQFYRNNVAGTNAHTKETWGYSGGNPAALSTSAFTLGYAVVKWRNVTRARAELVPGGTTYCSIDFPMFRTGDAYLMAAEAILRGGGGSRAEALGYVNEIRDRAYMSGSYGSGVSGRVTDGQLTLDFILDERARELYTENIRRTDLIRFGKYTKGYNWDWKGGDGTAGTHVGKDVDDKYNLLPIPQDEFTTNPNLTQNPDYTK